MHVRLSRWQSALHMLNTSAVPRLLIVDDDADARASLRRLLTSEFPSCSLAEAADAAQVFPAMLGALPSMVLLDLTMPRGHGFALFRTIKTTWPTVPVVLMTAGDREGRYAAVAKQLGAAAYIEKNEAPRRLADIVRTVLRGGAYRSRWVRDASLRTR
jgi:DNA-binding NarL/FixJ family response regulator